MEVPKRIRECAFHHGGEICSTNDVIRKMAQFLKKHGVDSGNTPNVIVNKAKEVMKCDSESCVLTNPSFQNFAGKSLVKNVLENNFKPKGPALNFNLLSNFNIDDVLDQFEKAFKSCGFVHVPFQMRDFADNQPLEDIISYKTDELIEKRKNLATMDIAAEYNNGMRCFGVVLNTDYSSGNGKHWFAIFGDFRKKPFTIEYFNSSGNLPIFEVSSWMKKTVIDLTDRMNVNRDDILDVIASRITHQEDKHSCGVYSLYYIYCRINGIPYTYFKENRVPDKLMHDFRKVFFRWY